MTPVNFTEKCKGRREVSSRCLVCVLLFWKPRLSFTSISLVWGDGRDSSTRKEQEKPCGAAISCYSQNSGMDRPHISVCVSPVGRKRRLLLAILHIQRDGKGCFLLVFFKCWGGGVCLRKGPGFQIPTPNISVCVKLIKTSKQNDVCSKTCLYQIRRRIKLELKYGALYVFNRWEGELLSRKKHLRGVCLGPVVRERRQSPASAATRRRRGFLNASQTFSQEGGISKN